ncbi:MAG: DUF4157 domain-containing protein [Methanosarcinales archaeon]|nr:DUF4157 domain-containing protein [Methanosarcinales archaeon]
MGESVAVAKEADAKKSSSPTRSSNSIHRVQNDHEMQLGSLGGVIGNIRSNGGKPSVESIAMQLSGMPTGERAPALLALQRTHGNQYVQRVVTGIQAKLKVGQPNDKYEQEADRVAEQVMRMSSPLSPSSSLSSYQTKLPYRHLDPGDLEGVLQRTPLDEFEELLEELSDSGTEEMDEKERRRREEEILRQLEKLHREEEIEQVREELFGPLTLQRSPAENQGQLQRREALGTTAHVNSDLASQIQGLRGKGQPMPDSLRAFFEPRFGYDFSQVRIHTDVHAAELARVATARAFTLGNDVVFGAGEYAPETFEGKQLLAHELTHVLQQTEIPPMSSAAPGSVPYFYASRTSERIQRVYYNCRNFKTRRDCFGNTPVPTRDCINREGHVNKCVWYGLTGGCMCRGSYSIGPGPSLRERVREPLEQFLPARVIRNLKQLGLW